MRHVYRAVLLCVAAVACRPDEVLRPNLPAPFLSELANGLQFSASISKNVIEVGDTATIDLVLHNPTQQTITLRFSSTCQILPYIWDSEEMVHPSGGAWGCGAAITSLMLNPSQSRIRNIVVHGGVLQEPMAGVVALNVGEHHAYGELGDEKGRTPAVTFTIVAK